MTLLSMIRDVCAEIGVPRPNAVCAATDPTMRALLSHAQEEGASTARLGAWQVLRKEKTFTSLATETQTNMVPADLARFVDGTFWNRTRRRPLRGPVSPQEWQQIKASTTSPVSDTFIVRGGDILINPTPSAGWTFAYEYMSTQWCESSLGTDQSVWTADTDVGLLPERLMKLGIIWRFKAQRGMAFDADYSKWEFEVRNTLGQENTHGTLDMSGPRGPTVPGINVQDGDWSV